MRKRALALMAVLLSGMMSISSYAGEWKQDNVGWWYQNDDGSYPTNSWQEIDGKQYYFGNDGYMLHDTTTPDGYYVDANGVWDQSAQVNTPKKETGLPDLSTYMSSRRDVNCASVLVELTNHSDSDIIVYGPGSRFRDSDYKSFNRNTHLVILSDDLSSSIQLRQLTLKPGEKKTVFFEIDGEKTWYDKNSEIVFCIEYQGKGYMCSATANYGMIMTSFDTLNEQTGTPFTLEQLKLLPY